MDFRQGRYSLPSSCLSVDDDLDVAYVKVLLTFLHLFLWCMFLFCWKACLLASWDFRKISALPFEECIPNIPKKYLEATSAQKLEGNKMLKSIIC